MIDRISNILESLEVEGDRAAQVPERIYRALGASAIGVRAGYLPAQRTLELLIEVPKKWSGYSAIPEWRGMGYELLALRLPPREEAAHLRLYLLEPEHRDVFLLVCEDVVSALEGITDSVLRVEAVESCLLRWRRFFQRSGPEGLSTEGQLGLIAELIWLGKMINGAVDSLRAVKSWKGCERRYHDFDFNGHVVEVKSTRTKEPKTVAISSERQLDDSGLNSLHLYVLSLLEIEAADITLPVCVQSVKTLLDASPAAAALFHEKLISAGYLDRDEVKYSKSYVVKDESLYRVTGKFPRIIEVPPGVGALKYRVILSACEPFREETDPYMKGLSGC